MKLIIEIPDEQIPTKHEIIDIPTHFIDKQVVEAGGLGFMQIPDNATNGEVIKAMFPNLEIEYTDTDEYTNKPRYVKLIVENTIITRMSADSWNAPYKAESEK